MTFDESQLHFRKPVVCFGKRGPQILFCGADRRSLETGRVIDDGPIQGNCKPTTKAEISLVQLITWVTLKTRRSVSLGSANGDPRNLPVCLLGPCKSTLRREEREATTEGASTIGMSCGRQ